jgi:uncharacterized protein YjiS (DUF1127 family)
MLARPLAIVASIPGWFRLRAEQKAMRAATDELEHSSDDVLSDIGLSHDEITCALRNPKSPRHDA